MCVTLIQLKLYDVLLNLSEKAVSYISLIYLIHLLLQLAGVIGKMIQLARLE